MAHLLLNLPTPVVVWTSFFGAGICAYLFSGFANASFAGRKAFWKVFIAGNWSHKSAITDLMVYIIGKVAKLSYTWAMPIFTLTVAGAVTAGVRHIFPNQHLFHSNIFLFLSCALFLIIVSDFAGWLLHFANHHVPVLWELHKVHHSAEFLNPLTSQRGNLFGSTLEDVAHACIMGIPTGLIIALLYLNVAEVTFLAVASNKFFFVLTLETLQHSHYPINFGFFDRIFISPHMHQVHHSSRKEHWDKNFGFIFSVWDWLFKTVYRPKKGELIVYGIGERETSAYQGLYGVYILPFIGIWRVITRQKSNSNNTPTVDRGFSLSGILWRDPAAAPLSLRE